MLEDGEPNDSAVFVTAVPNWSVGDCFLTGRGDEWRILAMETEIAAELVDSGTNAVFTVEPARELAERAGHAGASRTGGGAVPVWSQRLHRGCIRMDTRGLYLPV